MFSTTNTPPTDLQTVPKRTSKFKPSRCQPTHSTLSNMPSKRPLSGVCEQRPTQDISRGDSYMDGVGSPSGPRLEPKLQAAATHSFLTAVGPGPQSASVGEASRPHCPGVALGDHPTTPSTSAQKSSSKFKPSAPSIPSVPNNVTTRSSPNALPAFSAAGSGRKLNSSVPYQRQVIDMSSDESTPDVSSEVPSKRSSSDCPGAGKQAHSLKRLKHDMATKEDGAPKKTASRQGLAGSQEWAPLLDHSDLQTQSVASLEALLSANNDLRVHILNNMLEHHQDGTDSDLTMLSATKLQLDMRINAIKQQLIRCKAKEPISPRIPSASVPFRPDFVRVGALVPPSTAFTSTAPSQNGTAVSVSVVRGGDPHAMDNSLEEVLVPDSNDGCWDAAEPQAPPAPQPGSDRANEKLKVIPRSRVDDTGAALSMSRPSKKTTTLASGRGARNGGQKVPGQEQYTSLYQDDDGAEHFSELEPPKDAVDVLPVPTASSSRVLSGRSIRGGVPLAPLASHRGKEHPAPPSSKETRKLRQRLCEEHNLLPKDILSDLAMEHLTFACPTDLDQFERLLVDIGERKSYEKRVLWGDEFCGVYRASKSTKSAPRIDAAGQPKM
ncbi:hypothetical protein BV22DRAFT_1193402 [Leucogyrophana mollusca]|uniref:Uncharacterized protein n=1 Tax=Leucogyrophana mollusca TaxID=85980 RepID=A0ACB8BRA8_9AGAM|nr:hypothetical protein BV22DRAFT_1193402 [Leucogyrophana mollusca]